jgi:curli biogenesis system outer membrane secretion channel CsgG
MRRILISTGLLLACLAAHATEISQYTLVIKDHAYQPTQLKVPANTKIKLIVENRDATPEEFESTEFNREKIVLPNSTISVYVGPLKAGRYAFFGDFHQDTAQGALIAE